MNISVEKTNRGNPKLCIDGYACKKLSEKIYWKCENFRNPCGGRVMTNTNVIQPHIIIPPSEHSHPPNGARGIAHNLKIKIKNFKKKNKKIKKKFGQMTICLANHAPFVRRLFVRMVVCPTNDHSDKDKCTAIDYNS
uniref:FLYWCH-type domain-containing protein n=1 Tax=Strigamia maritima TaxID=126957 RepID=T1JF07_STRMM